MESALSNLPARSTKNVNEYTVILVDRNVRPEHWWRELHSYSVLAADEEQARTRGLQLAKEQQPGRYRVFAIIQQRK